jgi:ATP-dependent DNA ligase
MPEALPKYVQENYAKANYLELSSWLLDNPLPVICEPKYDGLRVFLFKSGDHLIISGRRGNIYSPRSSPAVFTKIPELIHAPQRMILDGEYLSKEGLHLFDVLRVDDRDMKPLPLYRRKEILGQLIADSGLETPSFLAETPEEIQKYAQESMAKGLEGIIVKNPASFYGQHDSWVKIRRFDAIDCFVIDLRDDPERRTWTIAVYDPAGKIVPLGEVRSYSERVDPRKVRLGSIVQVRYRMMENSFVAEFVTKLRRDKLAVECGISQIPKLEKKELLP